MYTDNRLPQDLKLLQLVIRARHQEAQSATHSALVAAMAAGDGLLKAKEIVDHGGVGQYCKNCGRFSGRIVDLATALPPDTDVTITADADNTTAVLKCGRSTFRPAILPADQFPARCLDEDNPTMTYCQFGLSAADTIALFGRVAFAIS
jgi:hypothetical protein